MKKIVIDIYGADCKEKVIVSGIAKAVKAGLDFFPVIVGDNDTVTSVMSQNGISNDRYTVIHTDKYFENTDPPTAIYGAGDDKSMAIAYEYLKTQQDCSALLSAGSTGILLVGSMCRLGLFGSLKFPALCSALPCAAKDSLLTLVDCGATTECTPRDLVRFALMGSAFAKSMCAIESPRVALMSVGREEGKGNELTKKAYPLLKEADINFVGNAEGSDMVTGFADVIVTDGFSGNLLLKAVEAAGKAAMQTVAEVCDDEKILEKINTALFSRFDFNSQGAATFLGTKKTVVKMHGAANADTVVASIEQILRLEKGGFISKLKEANI